MHYHIIPVTALAQNCTLLCCDATHRAAVVDPGGDVDDILAAIAQHAVIVEKILLTHGHADHAGGAAQLAQRLGVPIEGPQRDDAFLLEKLPQLGAMFGLMEGRTCLPDRWLDDGDTVRFGEVQLEVAHTPGHTPGHVCFFHRESALALVGDVLFAGSIGRSDFPRGDYHQLVASICGKLWPWGDAVRFIPGHGPLSTFGEERRSNPFVADDVVSPG